LKNKENVEKRTLVQTFFMHGRRNGRANFKLSKSKFRRTAAYVDT